jgi:hypothetical protein
MIQHKWHKEIKAWADGADIEALSTDIWFSTDYPAWHSNDYQFRIKQQPKEKQYLYVYIFNGVAMLTETHSGAANGGRYIGKIEVSDCMQI